MMDKGRGIARGHKQLGVRVAFHEAQHKIRTWRVRGAPRPWGASTVKEKLIEAGIEEVDGPTGDRAGPRGTWDWWFRGKVKDGNDYVEICIGETTLIATVETIRYQQRAETTKLKARSIQREEKGEKEPVRTAGCNTGISTVTVTTQKRCAEEERAEEQPIVDCVLMWWHTTRPSGTLSLTPCHTLSYGKKLIVRVDQMSTSRP